MTIYRLYTNEGTTYRRREPTRDEMLEYIRLKVRGGMPLASTMFCWTPVRVD